MNLPYSSNLRILDGGLNFVALGLYYEEADHVDALNMWLCIFQHWISYNETNSGIWLVLVEYTKGKEDITIITEITHGLGPQFYWLSTPQKNMIGWWRFMDGMVSNVQVGYTIIH